MSSTIVPPASGSQIDVRCDLSAAVALDELQALGERSIRMAQGERNLWVVVSLSGTDVVALRLGPNLGEIVHVQHRKAADGAWVYEFTTPIGPMRARITVDESGTLRCTSSRTCRIRCRSTTRSRPTPTRSWPGEARPRSIWAATANRSWAVRTFPRDKRQTTITASASLASAALLGATFTVTLPAGVTEAYLEIADIGPSSGNACNGASTGTPVYYTILVRPAAPSGSLSDAAGPGGAPSFCSPAQNTAFDGGAATPGDQFLVQTVGFDYPLYENSYTTASSNVNPAPAFAGANGQADVTISSAALYTVTAAASASLTERYVKTQRIRRLTAPRAGSASLRR